MPTNFEIAVISLVAINIIANIYYNYHNEEYYRTKIQPLRKPKPTPPKR